MHVVLCFRYCLWNFVLTLNKLKRWQGHLLLFKCLHTEYHTQLLSNTLVDRKTFTYSWKGYSSSPSHSEIDATFQLMSFSHLDKFLCHHIAHGPQLFYWWSNSFYLNDSESWSEISMLDFSVIWPVILCAFHLSELPDICVNDSYYHSANAPYLALLQKIAKAKW